MSLRDIGKTTIAIDVNTRSILKQLAGEGDVCDYVRDFAERELAKTGKGRALPGTEKFVSDNTIASVNSKLDKLAYYLSDNYILGLFGLPPVPARHDDEALIAFANSVISWVKARSMPTLDNSQGELELS